MTFPSFTPSLGSISRAATAVESLVMTVLPHGGQGAARRNAWRAMSDDSARARARREAEHVMERAVARAAALAAHPAAR